MLLKAPPRVVYYFSEHPAIVGFQWSHAQSWGSTWSFLFTSIASYLLLSLSLSLLLCRCRSPIPAVHSLSMSLISATIFTSTSSQPQHPRHTVVLAALQDPLLVAPLLPPRNPPLRPRLLLVLHLLPLALPPHVAHSPRHPATSQAVFFPALQPLHLCLHVVSMARVLAVVSGPRNSLHDARVRHHLQVPVLDRHRVPQCVLPLHAQLPSRVARLQRGLPCRRVLTTFLFQRGV
ncbi:Elongation of fatty acids protein 3 [Spatholobus suberectus]|nr:Elongation of fatty acids protein 3 [Spatholobus suberectus]